MKKVYIAPKIHLAGTVAGLTRSTIEGPCLDFDNHRGETRPGNCAPAS